jgi:hypothetical protein
MKGLIKIIALLSFGIIIFGCGKKNTSLLDSLPVVPIVNPDTRVLLKDNLLLYIQIENANLIRGITSKNVFQTTDYFKNFSYQPYSLPTPTHIIDYDRNYVTGIADVVVPTTIAYSTDYGSSWKSFVPNISGTTTSGYAGLVTSVKFLSNATMLLVTGTNSNFYSQDYPANNCWIFRINPETGKGDSLSCIKTFFPIAMQFANATTGYMLLSKGNSTYISKTTDGGANWNIPVVIANSYEPLNIVAGTTNVFLYNKNGGGYFSNDGGATWKKSKSNERFAEVVRINDHLLYATTEAGFLKSEDGGDHWNTVLLYAYGKLCFVNEKQGIRYTNESLYITENGGLNWKILLYRFPYIVT